MKSDGRLACRHSCLAVVDMQLRVYVRTVHVATICTFVCMCKTLCLVEVKLTHSVIVHDKIVVS